MTEFNLADCLEIVADVRGENPAVIQGDRVLSWKEFDQNAAKIGDWLQSVTSTAQAKVAMYTYNNIAYLEASYACLKASMVPVNINYRYKEQELLYLFNNSDSEVVLIHSDFIPALENILPKLDHIKGVIIIGDDEIDPKFNHTSTITYSVLLAQKAPEDIDRSEHRSGHDMIFIYTGGTTGMPKGVMWRQSDLYRTLAGGTVAPPPESHSLFREFVANPPKLLNALILPPLMHGTAFFSSLVALLAGGTVILARETKSFDPEQVWQIVEHRQPNVMNIVGDTLGRPLLKELERKAYDISSIEFIASAGALWSNKVKAGMLKHNKSMSLFDGLGSSEAHNIGTAVTTIDNIGEATPRFAFNPNTLLLDEKMKPLEIKPGVKGMIAVTGARPAGYYKDESKSKKTFLRVNGLDCTPSGDWAQVNEDGVTFTLLGRGSICINTGGEKVFPEEVEGVLKQFDGIEDAVVVGIADERWGEVVTAVISTDQPDLNPDELISFVKSKLANYKAPKNIVVVEKVFRGLNGKADYKETKKIAMDKLNLQ